MACPRTMSTLTEAPPNAKSTWPLFEAGGDFEYHLEVSFEEELYDDDRDDSSENLTDIELLGSTESLTSAMDKSLSMGDVVALLEHFSKELYRSKTGAATDVEVLHQCLTLFSKDYHYFLINNDEGKITPTYPDKIVVLEYEKTWPSGSNPAELQATGGEQEGSMYESMYDIGKLQYRCCEARMARCRMRFPVPAILLNGRHICRSSTISGCYELYGRSSLKYLFPDDLSHMPGASAYQQEDGDAEEEARAETSRSWTAETGRVLFDKVRTHDIKLLKTHGVDCIFDLMVEKKKTKYAVAVTSSEKVDKENRYRDFKLYGIPYPGCEFFKEFSGQQYCSVGLTYDWELPFVDAILDVPGSEWSEKLNIAWENYKSWDLVTLTGNYIKLILSYLSANDGGILIHCISGWDRTPLFISLLRMSLWADGLIHKSLSAVEMLYLTVGYDWFLFSHDLPNRMKNGEEIMYFCFDFLKYITNLEYSMRLFDADGVAIDDVDLGVRGSNTSLNSLEGYPMVFPAPNDDSPRVGSNLSPAKSSPAKSSPAKLSPAKSSPAKSSPAKSSPAKSSPAKSSPAKSSPAKLSPAKSSPAKLSPAKSSPPKLSPAKSSPAKSSPAKSSPAKQAESSSGLQSPPRAESSVPSRPATTPVAVPHRTAKRPDSALSLTAGSWQIMTDTGSVRSSTLATGSRSSPHSRPGSHNRRLSDPDGEKLSTSSREFLSHRRSVRLYELRRHFFDAYTRSAQHLYNNGGAGAETTSHFARVLDNLSKLGSKSRPP